MLYPFPHPADDVIKIITSYSREILEKSRHILFHFSTTVPQQSHPHFQVFQQITSPVLLSNDGRPPDVRFLLLHGITW